MEKSLARTNGMLNAAAKPKVLPTRTTTAGRKTDVTVPPYFANDRNRRKSNTPLTRQVMIPPENRPNTLLL